ncbi:MAG: FG-GAP-like repeat-containing protein, partial [Blastocatellia bacterium]
GVDPYDFSIIDGFLPSGLTLDSSGNLFGTPFELGVFNFTIQAQDSNVPAIAPNVSKKKNKKNKKNGKIGPLAAGGCIGRQNYTLVVTTDPLCTDPSFSAPQVFDPGGLNPRAVAIADFDGNQLPDLAVTNNSNSTVGLLLSNGIGSFAPAVTFLTGGTGVRELAVGDFDSNGLPDLVVANNSSNNVGVLINNGVGSFNSPLTFSSGGIGPVSVAVADFNFDEVDDIVVSNITDNTVTVLINNTEIGGFDPIVLSSGGNSPVSVVAFDVDGDEDTDIIVANRNSNNLAFIENNGEGFNTAITFASGGNGPNSISIGNFNSDFSLDLAVANQTSNNVSVLINNSVGSFNVATTLSSGGSTATAVTAGDFNGDSIDDLAVANSVSNTIGVLFNTGMGSFNPPSVFTSGGLGPSFLATADFTFDSKLDIALVNTLIDSNFNGSNVAILINLCGVNCTPFNFDPLSLPNGQIGTFYNQQITVSGGDSPYQFSINPGSLPPGLSFTPLDPKQSGNDGILISGTPTTNGVFNFTLQATDRNFCTSTQNYTIVIGDNCPPISILPATLPNPLLNVTYTQQLTATPSGNYSFSLASGSLPTGLTLSSSGLISGIPITSGTSMFTVQATLDDSSCIGTRSYILTVGAGAGRLGFSVNSFTVTEGSIATITVVRTNGGVGTVSVNYSTVNGTARSGVDYVNSSGTITFGNGDMSPKTFTVQTLPDDLSENNKTIFLSLGNPTGGAELSLTTATLNVIERDAPRPGRFAFSQTAYSVNELGGAATINVTRLDGSNVSASVNFATSAGANARAGTNYMETSGTLTFAPGAVSQSFNIPIFNDRQPGQDKIVNLRLSQATNGAIISGGTATLTIIESTPPVPPAVLQTANRVEFDPVNIGEMATRTITIRNAGGQDLTFNNPDVSGSDITLITPPRTNRLAANESTSFEVQFSPKPGSLGDVAGNITISSNGGVARIPVTARSIDMIAPSVKFMAPMGGELLRSGGQLRIRYDAEDNDALNDFTVSFVAGSNTTSKSISPNATGASSGDIGRLDNTFREIIWNIPGDLTSSTVRIMIRARDRAGNIVNAGSGQFSVQRPSTPAPVLQTIVRFTPVPDGVVAPPTNVTADATEIKDDIVTRPPDPVLLVNVTFDPPPPNQLLPPQNVKVKAGELTTNGIGQIANINRGINPKAEGDLVLAGFNVYRVPQPEDGTMPNAELIVDPENLVATLPPDAMGFMDMVPTGDSNNFSYSVTSFFGNGQMSGGSQPTGTDLPVIKNPIFTTGTVFLDAAGSFIKPGSMLIINDTDTFTLQFDNEATRFTVPKKQRSNGRNLTIKKIITKTAIVKLIVKNPDGNISVGIMFNRKGIVQSSKVNASKVVDRQINPQVDAPMLLGYNIYRTLQPADGRMLSPEEIIKPENLVGSIPGNMNSFTDTPSTGQGGNFSYSVTSFFGNGQMSGGSQPANTDLPIIKNPKFEGKLFFIDAPGSFIKPGATLIINDTESYTLEFDAEATRLTTNDKRGNPSNLTIDKFIKKGDTVRLIVRNSDGKISVGVTFTRR